MTEGSRIGGKIGLIISVQWKAVSQMADRAIRFSEKN